MSTRPKNQLALFGATPAPEPMPPFVRSETSKTAAEAVRPKAGRQRGRVLEFIRKAGKHGATRHEIAQGLGIPLSSVCARVKERGGVLESGAVVESGTREGPHRLRVAVLVAREFLNPQRN